MGRASSGGRARGGEVIQALRPHVARLALGAAALAGAAGLTTWASLAAGVGGPVVAAVGVVGSALLTIALLGRWPDLLPWAIAFLGGQYAASLLLRGGAIDEFAPLYAASLLVIAELSYWGLEATPALGGRSALLGRFARLLALAAAAACAGAVVLIASEEGAGSGVELQMLGLAAAAATLAVLTALAWRSSRR